MALVTAGAVEAGHSTHHHLHKATVAESPAPATVAPVHQAVATPRPSAHSYAEPRSTVSGKAADKRAAKKQAKVTKAKATISKLGKTMAITVGDAYHLLRVTELELTADYLAKVAEQKERDRAERARLREEEIAQREYERERDRLRKEHSHYEEAAAQLRAKGDHEAAAQAEAIPPHRPRSRVARRSSSPSEDLSASATN